MEVELMPNDNNALIIFNKDTHDVQNNSVSSPGSSSYNISYNSTPSQNTDDETENRKRTAGDNIPPNNVLVKQLEPKDPKRLFFKILRAREIDNVIHYWLNEYRTDKDSAIRKLYQLYVDLCAYQYVNVDNFLEEQGNNIRELVPYLESSKNTIMVKLVTQSYTGKYFLFIQNKATKVKHGKIEEFIAKFVAKCAKEKILYDFDLFKKLFNLFLQMANSSKRNIKHTGVFIALKHQTGLVNLGLKIVTKINSILKTLNSNQSPNSQEYLENKIEKLKTYDGEVNKMISSLQLNIFKNNWNFLDPKLHLMRQECILELYQWIEIFPGRYLTNENMNFILGSLIDPNKLVRYTAIDIVGKIVENFEPVIHSKLTKIIGPVSQQIRDIDFNVSILAVDTITLIRRYISIPSDIREVLCKTIYHIHFPLAAACGRYLSEFFREKNGDNGDKGLLYILMTFEAKAIQRGYIKMHPFVIESVYDCFPVLQDVKLFMQILEEGDLNEMYLDIWINILTESVHQAFTGKCSMKREKQKNRKVNQELVEHMIKDFIRNLKVIMNYCNIEKINPLLILMRDHSQTDHSLEFDMQMSQT